MGDAQHEQTYLKVETGAEVLGFGAGIESTVANIRCGDGRLLRRVVTAGGSQSFSGGIDQYLGADPYPQRFELDASIGGRVTTGECRHSQVLSNQTRRGWFAP